MQGLVPVKEYTSGEECRRGALAVHQKLLGKKPAMQASVEPEEPKVVEIFRLVRIRPAVQHDAHVYARYKFMAENPEYCKLMIERAVAAAIAAEECSGKTGKRVFAIPLIKQMCAFYDVSYRDITSERQTRSTAFLRQKMMWVIKNRTPFSYPEIGRKFNRDHTTVIHGVRKIDRLLAAGDPSVSEIARWLPDD